MEDIFKTIMPYVYDSATKDNPTKRFFIRLLSITSYKDLNCNLYK